MVNMLFFIFCCFFSIFISAFHSIFFVNTSTVVPVVIGVQGYPTWQQSPLSLVLGVGLGGAEPVLDILRRAWDRLRWTWRLAVSKA